MDALLAISLLISPSDGTSQAKKLFADCEAKLKAYKSISGTMASADSSYREEFTLAKPLSFRSIHAKQIELYCNGKVQWHHLVDAGEYFKRDVAKEGAFGWPYELDGFFGFGTGSNLPYFIKRIAFDMRKQGGKLFAAKTFYVESFERNDYMTFLVDVNTKLPVGHDQDFGFGKMSFRIENLQINVKTPPATFEWKPLPGLKEKKRNRRGGKVASCWLLLPGL